MKQRVYLLAVITFSVLSLPTQVFPQMVSLSPFDIAPPTILSEVKAFRAANPKMPAVEFVNAANKLLEKQGIAFTFSFDDATCQAIERSIKSLKKTPPKLSLKTKLRSVGGEPASLTLPPADFANSECSKCSITLPVLELTDNEFVALMWGRNIKFHLPANFIVSEVSLADDKDLTTTKTKWRIPFRSTPLGVSYDGNVLYLELPDPELKDISLAVFGEGVFQFATREEAESSGKGILLTEIPEHLTGSNIAFIRFENRGLKQTVKYPTACAPN
ncbi:MAG: hypothetical protein AB7F88_02640 [Pyrinomonadaceae bacterium]